MAKRGAFMDRETLKRYFDDPVAWPNGAYHDDSEFVVDGKSMTEGVDPDSLPESAVIEIRYGLIFNEDGSDRNGKSLVAHARQWLKKQSVRRLIVEAPADKLDAIMLAIKAAGGAVI